MDDGTRPDGRYRLALSGMARARWHVARLADWQWSATQAMRDTVGGVIAVVLGVVMILIGTAL